MTDKKLTESEKQFLLGLEDLTRKTGIQIGGCGCCGSPFITEAMITSKDSGYASDASGEGVKWIDPSDDFYWKLERDRIIDSDTPVVSAGESANEK